VDMEEAVRDAELVIEAIPERLELKQDLFRRIDPIASDDCIFASNTSSMTITEIAEVCTPRRRERFGGLHFFAPVPDVELVEVVKTPVITDEAYGRLCVFARRMRATALECTDYPGFVLNRLIIPAMLEAFKIIERGQTTPEELDKALEAFNWPPLLRLADTVGLDVYADIINGVKHKAGKNGYPTSWGEEVRLLDEMIARGELGKKTGRGFHEWPNANPKT